MIYLVFNIFLVSFIIMYLVAEFSPEYTEDEYGLLVPVD
jgi:hypothetical protein